MKLEPRPDRSARRQVDLPAKSHQVGVAGEQAKARDHRRGNGTGRRGGRRDARGVGLHGERVLLSGQFAARPLDRRPGRYRRHQDYQNDGDTIFGLFYDTIKGGDFRGREANTYRLAELSMAIIDQAVAQGVPFAREYGGIWPTDRSAALRYRGRSTPAVRPASVLLGAYSSLMAQVAASCNPLPRTEMLDLVVVDGIARGIVVRDMVTGEISCRTADAWCCAPAVTPTCSSCRPTPRGATRPRPAHPPAWGWLRQPVLHPDSPHLHIAVGRLSVQAHPDERVIAQRRPGVGAGQAR